MEKFSKLKITDIQHYYARISSIHSYKIGLENTVRYITFVIVQYTYEDKKLK
jgi:hypothetical protein